MRQTSEDTGRIVFFHVITYMSYEIGSATESLSLVPLAIESAPLLKSF